MTWQSETRAWTLAAAGVLLMGSIAYKVLTLPKLDGIVANVNAVTKTAADSSKAQAASIAAIEGDFRAEMWHLDNSLTTVDATLKTAQGTLKTASGTIGAVQGTLTATNEQLAHVGPLLDSARAATDSISPVVTASGQKLDAELDALHTATLDVDGFINRPALAATVAHVDTMTGNFALASTDFQTKFHALLFPAPCVGWKCKIGRDIEYVKVGSQFIEPAFYLRQLITGEAITGTITVQK